MFNKIEKLSETEFVKAFGNIFENANWIAKKLYKQQPFVSFQDLVEKMIFIFEKANSQVQLEILNSHPDLADKIKIGSLTPDSNKEQSNAGLNQCNEEEFSDFKNLNLIYKKKFGFPFIIAVKGKNKIEILINFKKRVLSNKKVEFDEAIKQVKRIANFRLEELKNKYN